LIDQKWASLTQDVQGTIRALVRVRLPSTDGTS
jgi:hypothetical protein